MKFECAAKVLSGIPYTGVRKGKFFYDLIRDHRLQHALELGSAHGTATCYMAAALDELGSGSIDTVDIFPSADLDPSVEQLAQRLGLTGYINIHRMVSSYTWFLKLKIEEQSEGGRCAPLYDLVFIDGPKDWTNDGAAFFMASKLLKPGGWMVLDDVYWTYHSDEQPTDETLQGYVFPDMSEVEFTEPQVEAIFRLLVMQDPSYSEFQIVDDCLAVARKHASAGNQRQVTLTTTLSWSYVLLRLREKLSRTRRM